MVNMKLFVLKAIQEYFHNIFYDEDSKDMLYFNKSLFVIEFK